MMNFERIIPFKKLIAWFILFTLGIVMNLKRRIFPHLAESLKKHDAVIQLKLRDNSLGRYYLIKDGKVKSRQGIHNKPDVIMSYESLGVMLRVMSPFRSQLDLVSAKKTSQLEMWGPDELTNWFAVTLNHLSSVGIKYGTDMGDGVMRYTSNTNGGPVFAYVKDGKIIRITPIDFDKNDANPWVVKVDGKSFSPPKKTTVNPHTMAWKSLIYSPDRIMYPMKRVDFDHKGERNPQNRGVSGYERITWDEALDIVSGEIKRVKKDHGPGAIMNGSGSHHTWGALGYWLGARIRFFNTIGWTQIDHNPDSWEGWFWGATHHWGHSARNGGGEAYSTVEDCMQNAEMVVFWSSDPEATSGVYGASEGTIRRLWLKDLSKRFVHIDPFYNHTAALLGGKWIAPKVGTDSAMILAIAYVWITENLYDKKYVETRTVGFDKWKSYILGEEDNIAKTPEWQEAETGVPAKDIRALAREWGTKRTYLTAGGIVGFGGACRTATGTDWARGLVCLMGMQGMGKPGVNMGGVQQGTPVNTRFYFPGYAEGGMSGNFTNPGHGTTLYQRMPQLPSVNTVKQLIPRLKIPEAIMNGKASGYFADPTSIEGQFFEYHYPSPGHSPVKMYYKYGGSHFGTMSDTNRYAKMYRTNDLEFVVNQSIWHEGESKFADIILPACTNFERWDISEFANCGGYIFNAFTQVNSRVAVVQHKCIEPLGESKSDIEIFLEISKRLGYSNSFSEGHSEFDWCKRFFDATDLKSKVSWRKFLKKGYYVIPPTTEKNRDPVSYRWFAEGREKDTPELTPLPADYSDGYKKGLQTQSGKIEFESSSLLRFDPDSTDRPPIMKYVPSWEGPHTTELYEKYPLQMVSPHPRYTFHTQSDGKESAINDISEHRTLVDGYYYWIARVNSSDAIERGIKENDLIKLYNDRGAVICAAKLTERVPPGIVHSYEASAVYDPIGEPGKSVDRGGCINQLTPSRMMIKKSHGAGYVSCLIEIQKWNGKDVAI